MRILDRLPVAGKHYRIDCHGQGLEIKPYQIIVQVSLTDEDAWNSRTPIFPALLDTGNNHAFSIQQRQLGRWAGIDPRFLQRQGTMRVNQRSVTLHRGRIWIHRNQAGKRDLRGGEPFLLAVDEGIIVYPEDGSTTLACL